MARKPALKARKGAERLRTIETLPLRPCTAGEGQAARDAPERIKATSGSTKSERKVAKLDDKNVRNLALPAKGNRVTYDGGHKGAVKGFGARVTAAGARSFVLNYRTRSGRERRITIGQFPDWQTVAARKYAGELKQAVNRGEDPLEGLKAERRAPTIAKLCERFTEEHAARKRDSTQVFYRLIIDKWILPELRSRKVADIAFEDIDGLHRSITKKGKPYIANRTMSVLSKMFNLAIKWKWRTDNPVKGIERNQEQKRQRYLSTSEIASLSKALAEHEDQQAANILRILLLTGARSEEVRAASWAQLDLENGIWIKPAANTKQKREHRVPLSAPARQLLTEIRAGEEAKAAKRGRDLPPHVFPGRGGVGFRDNIKRAWAEIIKAADFAEHARVHDLRHTYASILASAGLSLPVIGQLLGHTQAATTHRYSHLYDDPLRAATERVGAIVDASKKPSGKVVDIGGRR